MTSEESPRESDPNRLVEQSEIEHQTGPTLASESVATTDSILRKYHNCPYLGLHNDRTCVSTLPTSAHACYARRQRYLPSLEHQRVRCLSTTYPGCPIYPDERPHTYAGSSLYALQGTVSREGRARWQWPGWIVMVLSLALMGALAYAVAQGLLPMQLAFTPAPVATVSVAASDVTLDDVSDTHIESLAEIPTKTPTETSVPTPTLTSPDATPEAVVLGAEPTITSTPTIVLRMPDATLTAVSVVASDVVSSVVPNVTVTPIKTATRGPTQTSARTATQTPTKIPAGTPTATHTVTSVPTLTPTPTTPKQAAMVQSAEPTVRSTPVPTIVTLEEVVTITLKPGRTDVGWWASVPSQPGQIGNSFLYAGVYEAQAYISIVRFDLRCVPRGARIESAVLHLTGLSDDQLDRSTTNSWAVQLIPESMLPDLQDATFFTLYDVPSSLHLMPILSTADVMVGQVNEWQFDSATRDWLFQQLLDGATSVSLRIVPLENAGNSRFAWDSGYGSESAGAAPELVLDLGPTPLTSPPTPPCPQLVTTPTPTA